MNPLMLEEEDDGEILGVNVVSINQAHQLLMFGIDSNGMAQFWDAQSHSCVGTLQLPRDRLLPLGTQINNLSVTLITSRMDGLSYTIGTLTGCTLLLYYFDQFGHHTSQA